MTTAYYQTKFKKLILPTLNKQLDIAGPDMWEKIAASYNPNLSRAMATLEKRLAGWLLTTLEGGVGWVALMDTRSCINNAI